MKRNFSMVVLLICAAALVFGIIRLFELRFDIGDVYPQYSSLRSDPLGTMAFYESIARLPGLAVERDFSTSNRLPGGRETTYFHIAATIDSLGRLPEAAFDEIERFVNGGGRLVVTILPGRLPETAGRGPEDRKAGVVSLQDRWGVDFRVIDLEIGDHGVYMPSRVQSASGLLPETLAWHSAIVFANLNQAWEPVYRRGTDAVLIERRFGQGMIVMATDSYFLSNQAMQRDRQAVLLAWLIASGRNIIFDEAHLGVTERPGVATLMRKYRLHWFIAGLILLSGLFIWKNSASLVPAGAGGTVPEYVPGKDAAAGFDNLLRRSIPARDLLAVCLTEWKKSIAQTRKYSAVRVEQVEKVFHEENSRAEKDRDPVKTYQTISKILRAGIK